MSKDGHLFPIKISIIATLGVLSLAVLSMAGQLMFSSSNQSQIMVQQPDQTVSPIINQTTPILAACYNSCQKDTDCQRDLVCGPIPCQELNCNSSLVCQRPDCPADKSCDCASSDLQNIDDR